MFGLGRRDTIILTLTYLAGHVLNFAVILWAIPLKPYHPMLVHPGWQAFHHHPFWDALCRHDSGWLASIVNQGYYLKGAQSNVAFFPAYPYLTRLLSFIVGNHWIAGLIISQISGFAAMVFIYRIILRHSDVQSARAAMISIALGSGTIFLSAYYSESLFLCACAGSFDAFERKKLIQTGLWGCLAAMTRTTGILLLPCLMLALVLSDRWNVLHQWRRWLPLGLIPLGLLGFMGLLWYKVGDPLAFIHIQKGWGRTFDAPYISLWNEFKNFSMSNFKVIQKIEYWDDVMDYAFDDPDPIPRIWDILVCMQVLALVPLITKRFGWMYGSFTLASIGISLLSGRFLSIGRFAASLVPFHLGMGVLIRRRALWTTLTIFQIIIMVIITARFALWKFCG